MLAIRANELEDAVRIIQSQPPYKNRIWVSSMVDRNVGGDVSLPVVSDVVYFEVRHVKQHGREKVIAAARDGSRRRSRNTMGYLEDINCDRGKNRGSVYLADDIYGYKRFSTRICVDPGIKLMTWS